MNVVSVNNLSVSYHGEKALHNVTFEAEAGQLVGIIGPNGAGKSTLIKAMMGLISKEKGQVEVFEKPVSKVRKRIAYVPQRSDIDMDFPVLVEDVVVMGRYPHLSWWRRPGQKDRALALNCLDKVGMGAFAKRQIGQLSGGQQQRVFIARALAQQAELFFLDEPFAGIDMTSETIIIDILRELKNEGKTLFVVHHDLSKVEEYFDSLLLLNKELKGFGPKKDVFQVDLVSATYDGNVAIMSGTESALVVG